MKATRTRRKTKQAPKLDKREWNFSAIARVPDEEHEELVACCLWEYARESALLRELREKCSNAWRAEGSADSVIPLVAGNIKHPNNYVELFLREIVLQRPPSLRQSVDPSKPFYWSPDAFPPLTSGFPASWQSLSTDECAHWVKSVELKAKPYLPFRRGRLRDARRIVGAVLGQQQRALNPDAHPLELRVTVGTPLVALDRMDYWARPEDTLSGGFLYPNGTEVSVVEIDWAHFTDKEIAEGVKASRPPSLPEPKDTGGHKRGDWRATLERLGLLRLRSRYTVEETLAFIAASLTPKQREAKEWKKEKFLEPGECNREAEKAADDFRNLFPFLPQNEKPRSRPL